MKTAIPSEPLLLTDRQIVRLATARIFFGHQSVGNNILDGIRDLMASDARLEIKIAKSEDPQSIPGPVLAEFEIGQNGNPRSKDEAFEQVLARGFGAQGETAMYKYCYADIDASTDVKQVFVNYCNAIAAIKAKHPALQIVHITVPLTVAEPAAKAWLKSMLGKSAPHHANVKRCEFNSMLLKTFVGTDPVFDLAEVESTHCDRSRSCFTRPGEVIYTLAPEYTTDGGHLNEVGRQAAAVALLQVLSRLQD